MPATTQIRGEDRFLEWSQENCAHFLDGPSDHVAAAENSAPRYPDFESAESLVNQEITRPPEIIAGLIHSGSKVSLGGPSKANKSWILLDMGMSISSGTPFWGRTVASGRVLFTNLEIQRPFIQERIKVVRDAKGILSLHNLEIWNLRGTRPSYESLVQEIIDRIKDQRYGVVIVDPIYKILADVDDNSASSLTRVLNELDRIPTETGAAVVYSAHFAKGNAAGKESIDRVSGSGVYARDPDSILMVTPHEEANAFVVEPTLRNFRPVEPFVIRWEFPLMRLESTLDPKRLKPNGRPRKPIPNFEGFMSLFDELPLEQTSEDLKKEFKRRGWNDECITRMRNQAEQQGLIQVRRGPHNSLFMTRVMAPSTTTSSR